MSSWPLVLSHRAGLVCNTNELNIPVKTAGDYIDQLVLVGLLKEITGNSRNRIYQAEDIFNATK